MLQKIVLNAEGQPAIAEGNALPIDLTIAVLSKVNETLGKSKTKPLMNETGSPQS